MRLSHIVPNLAITCAIIFTACTACVLQQPAKKTLSDPTGEAMAQFLGHARIQKDLQVNASKDFLASDYGQMHALFSESGYADRGQTVVYSNSDAESGNLRRWLPNQSEPAWQKSLAAKDLKTFFAATNAAATLEDFAPPSFDGVAYEYLFLSKNEEGNLVMEHKIFMQRLGVDAASKEHEKLVTSFSSLVETVDAAR